MNDRGFEGGAFVLFEHEVLNDFLDEMLNEGRYIAAARDSVTAP